MTNEEITLEAIKLLGLKSSKPFNIRTEEASFSCPFHKDKTPSLFINFPKKIYHCFSCGKSGSIESLFYEVTGLSLRRTLGIQKDNFSNFAVSPLTYTETEDPLALKRVYVNTDFSKFQDAWENDTSRNYLFNRGITKEIAQSFKMGYVKNLEINTTYFRNRITIPIMEKGVLLSIEGRKINPQDEGPKVLYPRNCTTNTLYDLDNLDTQEDCFAVEGLMDLCILRESKTFQNSTAIFGANLTKRQIELIKSFKKFIYIPDNDKAGEMTLKKMKDEQLSNVFYLKPPKLLKNQLIKDVGDIAKLGITIDEIVNKNWLAYIKKI